MQISKKTTVILKKIVSNYIVHLIKLNLINANLCNCNVNPLICNVNYV